MIPDSTGDDWREHRRAVYAEIERLVRGQESVRQAVEQIRIDVARLQVKAAIWGAAAGTMLGGLIAILLRMGAA